MLFRLIALGAVIFCGAMTVLLVRMVYFPEFERLPRVDPEHVLALFLDRQDPDDIYIYDEAGELVGDVSLTPRRLAGSSDVLITFVARGMVALPNLPEQKLNWRGKIELGEGPERKVKRLDFSIRFSVPAVSVALHIEPSTMDFHYIVSQGGQVVTDSRTDPDAVGITQVQILMAAWGVDPGATASAIEEAKEKGDDAGWQARLGVIEIAEQRTPAYFIVMEIPGMGQIKLTLTEAGELLEIETPLGYEMLSAALREPPDPLPYNE